eukprot:Sdes_comp16237_c0_seq3m5535
MLIFYCVYFTDAFVKIHGLSLQENLFVYTLITILSGIALSLGYACTSELLKPKLLKRRDQFLTKPTTSKSKGQVNTNLKQEEQKTKDSEQAAVAEAFYLSLTTNNALYVTFFVITSSYLFKNLDPLFNYTLSVAFSASMTSFFSRN